MFQHHTHTHKFALLRNLLFVMILISGLLLPTADSWAASTSRLGIADFNVLNSETAVDGQETITGLLLAKPLLGILGTWVIQNGTGTSINLAVNLGTVLNGNLAVGSFVRVKSQITLLGIRVALSIVLDQYNPGQVVMRLADGALPAIVALRYGLTLQGLLSLLNIGDIYLGLTPTLNANIEQLVQQMSGDPDVIWVEPVYVYGIPEGNPYKTWQWGGVDPSVYNNQTAFQQVNLAPALDHYQGDGVVIAILDSGIDLQHPAFVGDLVNGWDFVANDAIPQDEGPGVGWGHGTHVAGIAAKIAPNSKLMPVRVLARNGRGDTLMLALAMMWATSHNADVLNMSLGTDFSSLLLREATAYALAEDVVVVAAAGNNGKSTVQYPAGFPGVIGVTAVDAANHKAEFANYGPGWIDLAAPGVGITSTMVGPAGSGYASWSGTSMATPFVSGAAALARQKLPSSTITTIAQLLQSNAADLNAANAAYINQLGRLLNIGAAIAPDSAAANTATTGVEPPAIPTTALSDPSQTPTLATPENQYHIYLPLVEK